jgi:hypothetical protein
VFQTKNMFGSVDADDAGIEVFRFGIPGTETDQQYP